MQTAFVIVNDAFEVEFQSSHLQQLLPMPMSGNGISLGQLEAWLSAYPIGQLSGAVLKGKEQVVHAEVATVDGKKFMLNICGLASGSEGPPFLRALIQLLPSSSTDPAESGIRTLVDAVPQLIWTNDAEGKANYFNARWYEYSGLSYEQCYGVGWQAIVHPDDASASGSKWQESLQERQVFDSEYRLRSAAGKYRWFIGRNVPFTGDDGQLKGWFGTATDIDAQKTVECSLRESEERLKVTLGSATDYAIITTDIDGRIRGWSRGAEQIFGYSPKEVLGLSAEIIFTESDRLQGAPQAEMRNAREFGRATDERWHLRKDGTAFFMSGVMTPIQSDVLMGYVKVARDLTERRASEQKLQNTEERYRIALAAAGMIAWDYDILADKIVWNNVEADVTTSEGQNRLSVFMSFVFEKDKSHVEEKMREALTETGVFQAEFRVFTLKSGELKWMSSYGKVLYNDRKEAYRLVGVMFDISKRKALEEQQEEFIGIASHELKTPVTSIKAYAEIVEEMLAGNEDEGTTVLVGKLIQQVNRLEDLIRRLLDTTKISEGHMRLHLHRFDMNKLIRGRIEDFQLISPRHRFIASYDPDGSITADSDLITQVLINLLSNAVKYSPDGGDIIVSTRKLNDVITVSVQDSGIGIPASDREKIFLRFFRATKHHAQNLTGLGLGLYITAGIIRQHGGRIWVDSEPGQGSIFSFLLPAAGDSKSSV